MSGLQKVIWGLEMSVLHLGCLLIYYPDVCSWVFPGLSQGPWTVLLHLLPDFPSPFSLDICLCCGSLQVHTQHPLFEGGICAPCKVSREVVGLGWHCWRRLHRNLCPLLRTSSWRPSSFTIWMGTRVTVPYAASGKPCSSVRAPTVPGEAGPNSPFSSPKNSSQCEKQVLKMCVCDVCLQEYSHHMATPSVLRKWKGGHLYSAWGLLVTSCEQDCSGHRQPFSPPVKSLS